MSGRRVETVIINTEGRDKGKHFRLTEMSATDADDWSRRFMHAVMAGKGVDMPEDAGLAAVLKLGFQAISSADPVLARPVLADMMSCVVPIPDPSRPQVTRFLNEQEDIEEIATLWQLRYEVFKLHTGFSIPGGILSLIKLKIAGFKAEWQNISTSLEGSEQ